MLLRVYHRGGTLSLPGRVRRKSCSLRRNRQSPETKQDQAEANTEAKEIPLATAETVKSGEKVETKPELEQQKKAKKEDEDTPRGSESESESGSDDDSESTSGSSSDSD